jgi:hypothetical protein
MLALIPLLLPVPFGWRHIRCRQVPIKWTAKSRDRKPLSALIRANLDRPISKSGPDDKTKPICDWYPMTSFRKIEANHRNARKSTGPITEEGKGKLHLFVAIDRTSKFAFAQLHPTANVKTAVNFLAALIKAVPYKIHIVLTDNGIQFGDSIQHRSGPTARYRLHMFDRVCREHDIEHRFTKPNHLWTNGQVERMNRSLKEATVKRYHYDTHRSSNSTWPTTSPSD